MITNIKAIDELKLIKKQLEEYYKLGGEFEKQCRAITIYLLSRTSLNYGILNFELDTNVTILLFDNATSLNY